MEALNKRFISASLIITQINFAQFSFVVVQFVGSYAKVSMTKDSSGSHS